jgi:pimeloyl-ACP methyl ester carboxylesterase
MLLVLSDADSRTVVSSDGTRLAVREAGARPAATIVFVHGYPDTSTVWEPVLERLAADFHVVAYDVRGAGASDIPRGLAAYDLQRLTDDFLAVSAAVSPDRPVHLVGHDWGGIQGWEFATSHRCAGRIASFTAVAGPALSHGLHANREPLRRGRLREFWSHVRRSWYILVLCAPGGPTFSWRLAMARGRWRRALVELERLSVDDDFPAPSLVSDGCHGANLYRRNILPMLWRRTPLLAPAHAPVQLIIPDGDRFISPSYYDAARRAAPELSSYSVPGSHWAPRAQPERVAQLIAAFVSQHGA